MIAALNFVQGLLALLFCLICLLLILLILIQRGRGGGLSGAFGGVGSYSPFGTKTGDALTWATVFLTAMYLFVAVISNYVFQPAKMTVGVPTVAPAPAQPDEPGQPSAETTAVQEQPADSASAESSRSKQIKSLASRPAALAARQPLNRPDRSTAGRATQYKRLT